MAERSNCVWGMTNFKTRFPTQAPHLRLDSLLLAEKLMHLLCFPCPAALGQPLEHLVSQTPRNSVFFDLSQWTWRPQTLEAWSPQFWFGSWLWLTSPPKRLKTWKHWRWSGCVCSILLQHQKKLATPSWISKQWSNLAILNSSSQDIARFVQAAPELALGPPLGTVSPARGAKSGLWLKSLVLPIDYAKFCFMFGRKNMNNNNKPF